MAAARVISAVRRAAHPNTPVFAKLSPDVTDIGQIARAVADAGADGISLINTLLGMVIDPDTLRPALGGITGGLSGPAIRPVAVRCVWQVHQAVPHLPLLGMGGIRTGAGRAAVHPGRRLGGVGGHRGVPRPDRADPDRRANCRPNSNAAGSPRCDAVGFAHRQPRPGRQAGIRSGRPASRSGHGGDQRMTFGSSAGRRRWPERGPICLGIDPHAALLRTVGPGR